MEKISLYIQSLLNGKEELSFHSKEVSKLAYEFGIFLGLGLKDIKNLKIGGLLHDLGKIEISEYILFKQIRLTDEEFALIKEHSQRGYNILQKSNHQFSQDVLDIILQHHERVDGLGYPNKLKHHEINKLAKIVSLCDVFSAITNKRSYKNSFSHEYALEEIEKGLGTQFDKELGSLFVQFMNEKYGEKIKMNTALL